MTVYKPKDRDAWRYDFYWKGKRYVGSTEQLTERDAREWELDYKRRLRRRAAGLEAASVEDTPRFSAWAKVTLEHAKKRKKLKRPEQFATNLRMVLGFWGARPTKRDPIAGVAPYHDLRLGDPIKDPELIEQFEQWMDVRGVSGARKNHYRSACSVMYRVALLPQFRRRSGVRENPFAHIERDRVRRRIRTMTSAQLRAIITAAPWHVRLALAIGALAPKLRLRNVLGLRWDQHLDADLSLITEPEHKTDRETGLPLIIHVSSELRAVLTAAKKFRSGPNVVHYYGRQIADIKTALKHAVEVAAHDTKDATLVWGRSGGVTYHSLRHTMATEFARMGLPEALRARLLGHSDLKTTQIYTHLVPLDEVAPLEALGGRMPVADLIDPQVRTAAGPRTRNRKKTPHSARPDHRRWTRQSPVTRTNAKG